MAEATFLKADDLEVDRTRRCVLRGSEVIDLPRLSFEFLIALIEAAPAIVTHDELVARVWRNHFVSPETIAQRARLLRVSLGDSANEPRYVTAVRGIGYRWMTPVLPCRPLANGAAATPPRSRRLRYGAGGGGCGNRRGALGLVVCARIATRGGQRTKRCLPSRRRLPRTTSAPRSTARQGTRSASSVAAYLSPERWKEIAVTASIRSTPDGARCPIGATTRRISRGSRWARRRSMRCGCRATSSYSTSRKPATRASQRAQYPPGIYPPEAGTQTTADVVTFELQPADRVPSEMVWVPASSAPRLPPFLLATLRRRHSRISDRPDSRRPTATTRPSSMPAATPILATGRTSSSSTAIACSTGRRRWPVSSTQPDDPVLRVGNWASTRPAPRICP